MATSEKIKLQGASAYKKDLQQIAAQSKALAAEMKMVKSSFDKSTTAEEKNEAISKQLTKQIELQKQRVDMLRKAYEEEVAVSGKQSEASAKAQEALFKGQSALNKMEQENRKLAQAEDDEAAAAQRNESAHGSLNGVLKTAGAAIAAVAAAAAAAAAAIWDAANAAGEWADNILTLSSQTDLSVETLQKWDYAARFIDVDTQTMVGGLKKVQSQITTAISKKKKYIQILGGEKIAIRDANGELKSAELVFYETIEALGRITDETKRNAAAQEIFGKSYTDLKPLIDAGFEGLRAYGEEAEQLGLIMSDDAVKGLGEFDDQMERLKSTVEVAGRELAVAFLPATQQVAESLTELASTVTNALSDGFQDSDVDTILDALFGQLSKGLNDLSEMTPAITKFVVGLIEKITNFVTENGPLLINTALQIILGIVNGLSENLPEMIPAIVEMVMTIVTTLTDPENTDQMMQAAIGLIKALAQGIINAVPLIIERLPEFLTNIVESLIVEGYRLYEAASELVNSLADGIGNYISDIIPRIKQYIQENVIDPIKEKGIEGLKEAGQNLVEGLWSGIRDKYEWVRERISSWVGDIVEWFKNKFGVHSPSTIFMGIGENLAEGLALGWRDGMSEVRSAMSALPAVRGDFSADASPYGFGGSVINIYPQQLDNGTMDYIFARVNSRMGAAI